MIKNNLKLGLLSKLFLSVFPFLTTILFLDILIFEKIPFDLYEKIWIILFILMVFQMIFLVFLISRRPLESGRKVLYILLILSIALFHLYYIWFIDDRILKKER